MPLRSGRRRGCGISDLERGNPRRFAFGPSGVWIRLDRSAVVVTGAVASLNDLCGSNNHVATQATTTKRPTYQTTGSGPKGRPTMTFDGVDDLLQFTSNLTVGGATAGPSTFFGVLNKITDTTPESTFFVTREKGYLSRMASVNAFHAYLNLGVNSGLPIPTTLAIVEIIDRAANDVDFGVNGTLVNRNTGTGYPLRTNPAAIGGDWSGVQLCNSAYAELMFYGNALSKTGAGRIRRYLKSWHGIAIA